MRDLIKILIALAFIVGAFWVGNYMACKKGASQLHEVKAKVETNNKLMLELHDSLRILKTALQEEKAKNKIDSAKKQIAVKHEEK